MVVFIGGVRWKLRLKGGITMAIILVIVVPLAILLAWAVVQDLKRRRRHALSADVESRARAVKAASEARLPPGGGG